MGALASISDYLRMYGTELGRRVIEQFPALHQPGDPVLPGVRQLKRQPFPAQTMAIMGIAKRWQETRCAAAIAECGTGKTLISLASIFAHAQSNRFSALAMMPPQLVEKWARECFLTLPGVRVFVIDGIRNGVSSNGFTGVNEMRLRNGRIVREGVKTTLSELRLAKSYRSPRVRWQAQIGTSSLFLLARERAKLSYFWRHSYGVPQSGPFHGSVFNPDTGKPVLIGDDQLRRFDFCNVKHSEIVLADSERSRRPFFSALWQADNTKVQRMAPIEFIGRYLGGFFDYGIGDEVHELKGQTAQGNALGTMASVCERTLILTGTLLGGYADDLFNILYRLDPAVMRREGFSHGEAGVRQFADAYGVLEKVTTIEESESACSKSKITTVVRRRPGASPLLFGKYLMNLAAFVSLEDISDALPPYREEVLSIEMDPAFEDAYSTLEEEIRRAIRENPRNTSMVSAAMNALLLYPDRPYGLGTVYGFQRNEETRQREKFVIATPPDLDERFKYAKERRLLEEIKGELACGRKVQVFAVYTRKRDVTGRLKDLLVREGIRAEVLTADVSPERREAWYERHFRNGMQVSIAHPKLVMTGLDILECPTILWYETGYSIYVLRQASRRSWRIGQKRPVRVAFLTYAATAQERCLRLMGKKLLVSLALEGKFQGEGLESMDVDDDLLTAMARELVTRQGVGEQAAEIWKTLQVNHRTHTSPPIQGVASEEEMPQEMDLTRSELQPPEGSAVQLTLF